MKLQPFDKIAPLPEGGPWKFVSLRDGRAAPQHLVAEGSGIRLEVEVNPNGQGRAVKLEICEAGNEGVTSIALRRLAMGRLVQQAVAGAAQDVEPGDVNAGMLLSAIITKDHDQAKADTAFYRRYVKDVRRPRQGSPLTDRHLSEVARLYRKEMDSGRPTQAIMDLLHVARPTASRWVAAAREREFLGPAITGRAGEKRRRS